MAYGANVWGDAKRGFGRAVAAQDQQVLNEADMYRQALAKASYGEAGRAYGQGLGGLQGWLSTQGPLGDSGARAALGSRLATNVYGGAANRVAGGYADYLGQAMNARRQFKYQMALIKAQRQQTGLGGFFGGAVGAFAGPALGAWGKKIGEGL